MSAELTERGGSFFCRRCGETWRLADYDESGAALGLAKDHAASCGGTWNPKKTPSGSIDPDYDPDKPTQIAFDPEWSA